MDKTINMAKIKDLKKLKQMGIFFLFVSVVFGGYAYLDGDATWWWGVVMFAAIYGLTWLIAYLSRTK